MWSLGFSSLKVSPVMAPAGHASTHKRQDPQRFFSGVPAGNGASVYTVANLDTDNILSATLYVDGVGQQTITSFTTGELDFNEVDILVPAGTTNGVNFEVQIDITGR